MGVGDVLGDGKAEAGSRFIKVAGVVEADEGPERLLALVGGNAGAIVIHIKPEAVVPDLA